MKCAISRRSVYAFVLKGGVIKFQKRHDSIIYEPDNFGDVRMNSIFCVVMFNFYKLLII